MSVVSDEPAPPDQGRRWRPDRPALGPFVAVRWVARRWDRAELFNPPPRADWPLALKRVRLIGFVVLAVQLIGLCWWSSVLVHRFALTRDYSAYAQAAWLFGHGHLDPYSTILGQPFWQNDAEFIIAPIAALLRVAPSPVTFPWLQDLALVATELVAFLWVCDLSARHAQRHVAPRAGAVLAAVGLVLLVANPWTIWTVSFDVHVEPFITLFAVGAARDLYRGRRTAWIWIVLGLVCGAVGASYVGAVGLSSVVCGRVYWKRGAAACAAGLALLVILEAAGVANKTGLVVYAPLVTGNPNVIPRSLTSGQIFKAAIEHPGRVSSAVWGNATNLWANLSPGGLLGLLWLPVTVPLLLVTAEGGLGHPLAGIDFSLPGFQNVAYVAMMAVGTVGVCSALAPRVARWARGRRWVPPLLIALLLANALAWAIVWLPEVGSTWLLVSPGAARVLGKLHSEIGPDDEVVVSQGVSGQFATRRFIYLLINANTTVPVQTHRVWIVLAPRQGIETARTLGVEAVISALYADPQMRLVTSSNGIWAFEWTVPKGTKFLSLGAKSGVSARGAATPGWLMAGGAATTVRKGPMSRWHASNTAQPGYVVAEGYWRGLPGRYTATVDLSAAAHGTNVELWDSTTGTLLGRKIVSPARGIQQVQLTAELRHVIGLPGIGGWGPWSISPLRTPGDNLEVRVWAPGGHPGAVDVYRVGIGEHAS